MDEDTPDQTLLDHGWKHFEFHARQRLSLFNFYIILCGLMVAAWANVMVGQNRLPHVAISLGVLLTLFSVVFWRMDERNAHLTKRSERVMAQVEKRIFDEPDFIFAGPDADQRLREGWGFLLARQWSHGQSLRVFFALMGLVGTLGALVAIP